MENFEKMKRAYGRRYPLVALSCLKKAGLEDLKLEIFKLAGIIRVYSKPPGKDPDMSKPYAVPAGSTVMDVAEKVHKDFVTKLKYARIWGSAKFDGIRGEDARIERQGHMRRAQYVNNRVLGTGYLGRKRSSPQAAQHFLHAARSESVPKKKNHDLT